MLNTKVNFQKVHIVFMKLYLSYPIKIFNLTKSNFEYFKFIMQIRIYKFKINLNHTQNAVYLSHENKISKISSIRQCEI